MKNQVKKIVLLSRSILALVLGLYLVTAYNACSHVAFTPTAQSSSVQIKSSSMLLINNGAPYTNDSNRQVTLTLQNSVAAEMYITNDSSCSEGGTWQPYQTSKSWVLQMANGQNTVYAAFRNGDISSDCVNASIVHDDVAPQLSADQLPAYTNQTAVNLPIAASDSGSGLLGVTCLESSSGVAQSCVTSLALADLDEGNHHLTIQATDRAGNTSASVDQTWVVDTTPPTLSFNSTPASVTNKTTATFVVSATDNLSPISGYSCRVDQQAPAPCTATFSLNVSAGHHQVFVSAMDAAGNIAPEISYSWSVNTATPTVTYTNAPNPFSNIASPSFSFIGTDGDGTLLSMFSCQMDSGTKANCVSPYISSPLVEGSHTMRVWTTNAAGTTSAAALYTWVVDLTAPTVKLTQKPDVRTNKTDATFLFTVKDNAGGPITTTCSVDGSAPATCNQSVALTNLSEGSHRLQISARDAAGNLSVPLNFTWVVDLTPPAVQITSGPSDPSIKTTANFAIQATDPSGGTVSQIQCKLETQSTFSTCTNAPSFSDLSVGAHTFSVRATDSAGNMSDTVTWSWMVVTNGPVITFQQVPADPTSVSSPAVVQYTVVDSIYPGAALTIKCGFNGIVKPCDAAATMTLAQQILGEQAFTITAANPAGLSTTKTIAWTAKNILQFPQQSTMAAIAYEDLYPNTGDADYNDFMTDFRIVESINSANQITKIDIDFYPRAAGAGYDHSLIVVLDGKKDAPSNITAQTKPMFNGNAQISLQRYDASGRLVSTQSNLPKDQDLTVFASTHALFGSGGGGQINTNLGATYVAANQAARIEIVLTNPEQNTVGAAGFDLSQFRFVLHVKDTNKDIDLIDVDPTNFDASGSPFGFVIPANWQWPVEGVNISTVYPQYDNYRRYLIAKKSNPTATAPANVMNWFNYPVPNSTGLYPVPAMPVLLPDPTN